MGVHPGHPAVSVSQSPHLRGETRNPAGMAAGGAHEATCTLSANIRVPARHTSLLLNSPICPHGNLRPTSRMEELLASQSAAHEPQPALSLFLQIKFYWNAATLMR